MPELRLYCLVAGWPFDAAVACQHTLDVAIQYRAALVPGQRADCGGGGATDAGQLEYLLLLAREFAVIFFRDDPCGTVKVASARVVAQPAPMRQHLLLAGCRERLDHP